MNNVAHSCTKVVILALAALGMSVLAVPAQAQDDDVRGAFLTTRPKTTSAPSRTNSSPRRRGRRPRPSTSGTKGTASDSTGDTATTKRGEQQGESNSVSRRVGMGLTLFMRDANGLAMRVAPEHEFHKGDRVRVLLETIDEGGNYIESHVPFEIPDSTAPEERLRWFRFDETPGTERLFFVFTRQPLTAVPIEDELVKLCGGEAAEGKTKCPWQPTPEVWARVQEELKAPVEQARLEAAGRPQTKAEQGAVARGIGLSKGDPEPSLILMSVAKNPSQLVTKLDLVHK
jgi:hypothetical protein